MSTHALQTAAVDEVEARDSATLEILVKALTAGCATIFTASLGPRVAVLAAVLATLAAEGVRQVVKQRNWGIKRVGFLVTLTVALSHIDMVVGRNARNLLGGSTGASRLLDAVAQGTGQIVLTTTAATTLAVGGYGAASAIRDNGAPLQKTFHIGKNGKGKLTFESRAGERVFLKVSGSTIGTADVGLYGAEDEKLDAATYYRGQDSYLNTVTLPATRTYTVWVDPHGTDRGRLTVTVIKVPPDQVVHVQPTTAGVAVPVRATLGQTPQVRFRGRAGERVFLKVSGSTIGTADVGLYGAEDEKLDAATYYRGQDSYLNTVTLPATRTYTVWVDPHGTDTGRLTVTVIKVPLDRVFSLRPTAAGSPITIRTSLGQTAIVRFRGLLGQTVVVRFTSSTIEAAAVQLIGTDDKTLAEGTVVAGALEPTRLPYRGEYRLVVDPEGTSVGSVRVNIALR